MVLRNNLHITTNANLATLVIAAKSNNYADYFSVDGDVLIIEDGTPEDILKSLMTDLTDAGVTIQDGTPDGWNLDDSYYNKDVVKCPVYSKLFKGKTGKVYVQDNIQVGYGFTYTCSFGASSEYSYTGCFKLTTSNPPKSVTDAMRILDIKVRWWLSGQSNESINKIVAAKTGFILK
jgi:hypothetical protein